MEGGSGRSQYPLHRASILLHFFRLERFYRKVVGPIALLSCTTTIHYGYLDGRYQVEKNFDKILKNERK